MTTPLNSLTDTWNSGGVLYGLKYNIINTASGAGSKLIDLQISTSTRFNVNPSGTAFFGNTTSSLTLDNSATDPAFIPSTGSVLFTGGTVTANKPVINATQEWNSGVITFTGLKLNITNTASAAGSLLCDFQIGGTSLLSLDKLGVFSIGGNALDAGGGGYVSVIQGGNGNNYLAFRISGSYVACFGLGGGIAAANNGGFGWSSSSSAASGSYDLLLARDGAGIFAQRNFTNAQTFRVYNTTDAGNNNYERGVFDWTTNSNVLTIGVQVLGTGTLRKVKVVGAGILTDATVLPTSNPSVTGQLWNNGGVVTVS